MNYTVYKHIFPNNKIYIGITNRDVNSRWRKDGKGYINCPRMNNAIQKYGWNNVQHEILYENLTKEEAEQKEIELIAQYKSNQREYGYNIANGGCHRGKTSEETKNKIREKNMKNGTLFKKGDTSWNKGIPMTEEAKKKMIAKKVGKKMSDETKEKHRKIMLGKKLSKESIEKRTKTRKEKYPNGIYNPNAKEVICIETNKIYRSATLCAREMSIYEAGVNHACKSKTHYYKGYHFVYLQTFRDNNKLEYEVANAIIG